MVSALRSWVAPFIGRVLLATISMAVVLAAWAAPASAHADLSSSDPANGAVVSVDIRSIELRFTKAAEPTTDGLVLVGPDGPAQVKTSSSEGGAVWTLKLAGAPAAGAWTVKWKIRADDTHSKDGTFSFEVAAADIAASAATSTPAAPTTETAVGQPLKIMTGEHVATWARAIWMVGLLLPAGVLAFMLWAFEGSDAEIRFAQRWMRVLAIAGVAGAVVELFGNVAWSGGGFAMLWGPIGLASALRITSGLMFVRGVTLVSVASERPDDRSMNYSSDGSLLVGQRVTREAQPAALARVASPALAIVASVALVASMLADGHSLEANPRVVMWLITTVHAVAGAVWAGGVVALVLLLSSRWLRGRQLDGALLGFRFSSLAAVSLGLLFVAGVFLAIDVLDTPQQLFSSTWGRVLLVKLVAVAAAAACGAFNHFVVLPELAEFERLGRSAQNATEHHLRRVGLIEVSAMIVVLLATAWMVGSSPT